MYRLTLPFPLVFAGSLLLSSGCIIEASDEDNDSDSDDDDDDADDDDDDDEEGDEEGDSDGDSDGDEDTDGDTDGDESCYEPTADGPMDIEGSWASPTAEAGSHTITAPTDPGGGFIRIAFSADHMDVIPTLVVQAEGDDSGAIISGSAANTSDTTTKHAVFSAAPGQTYTLEADQFGTTEEENYPVDYTITWEFTSTVDCYEPNDSAEDAVAIALDQTIEAYALAGFTENSLGGEAMADWYSVELEEAGDLSVELITAPGDHRTRIRVWDSSGTDQLGNNGGGGGGETYTTEADGLEAGTYLISFEVASADPSKATDDDPDPAHFTQPYQLQATVE